MVRIVWCQILFPKIATGIDGVDNLSSVSVTSFADLVDVIVAVKSLVLYICEMSCEYSLPS